MENTCKHDLLMGVYSGFVLSVFVWLFHLISQSIKIIIPEKFDKKKNLIKIRNRGLVFCIGYLTIIGQVTFKEKKIIKRYTVKVDGQFEYLSPKKLHPLKSRDLLIDIDGCISGHPDIHTIDELLVKFPDSELCIYVKYLGILTNIQKITSRDFELMKC